MHEAMLVRLCALALPHYGETCIKSGSVELITAASIDRSIGEAAHYETENMHLAISKMSPAPLMIVICCL